MGMQLNESMPDSWGIPFIIYTYNGIFRGKVRLNKILSMLQREGFPVKNIFINAEMGPYDETIDLEVEQLKDDGIIIYKEEPTSHENNMLVYELTSNGVNIVKNDIIKRINDFPYPKGFLASLKKILALKFSTTKDIISMSHKELFLDDLKSFIIESHKTYDRLNDIYKSMEDNFIDYCSSYLYQIGMIEFTIESLKRIIESEYDSPTTGKNHVLYNSKILIKLLETHDIRKQKKFKDCKEIGYCNFAECPILSDILEHRFHCIEYNSSIYGIQQMIDYRTYDFREIFESK